MAKASNSSSLRLFNEILKNVEAFGVEKTADWLAEARKEFLSIGDERVDYVLQMISKHLNIEIAEIIKKGNKYGKQKFALQYFCYYMHNEPFNFGLRDIGSLLGKSPALMCRYYADIDKLKKSRKRQDDFAKFDIHIAKFKIK